MIGNIKRPNMPKAKPFNPDDYFDPLTHIATEDNFIKLLEDGWYEESLIGYKVQLSNSVDYNNGIWVIADVNHDSTNTGQTNCYDLINSKQNYSAKFSSTSQIWRDSSSRTWLNGTIYNQFSSAFKNHMIKPKYQSNGNWYQDDYLILPSFIEVNGTSGTDKSYYATEGVSYPIFTDNNSRIRYDGSGNSSIWFTRTLYTNGSIYVWCVQPDGSLDFVYYDTSNKIMPIMRVQ